MLAFHAARDHGFTVKDEDLKEQTEFIADFLGPTRQSSRRARGPAGRRTRPATPCSPWSWADTSRTRLTAAVAEYLLKYQSDKDHWRVTSNRPPSEASNFTTNYLALRALRVWGTPDQKEAIEKRRDAVREWLLKTRPRTRRTACSGSWPSKRPGPKEDAIRERPQALLKRSGPDGSWSQLDDKPGDAYATGSALVALHEAGGLAPTDPAYRRGRVPAADPAGGRVVGGEVAEQAVPAVLRERVPVREGPVHLGHGQRLGDGGAVDCQPEG